MPSATARPTSSRPCSCRRSSSTAPTCVAPPQRRAVRPAIAVIVPRQLQHRVADLQAVVALDHHRADHAPPVEVGAVRRAEVLDVPMAVTLEHPGVHLAGVGVVERHLAAAARPSVISSLSAKPGPAARLVRAPELGVVRAARTRGGGPGPLAAGPAAGPAVALTSVQTARRRAGRRGRAAPGGTRSGGGAAARSPAGDYRSPRCRPEQTEGSVWLVTEGVGSGAAGRVSWPRTAGGCCRR